MFDKVKEALAELEAQRVVVRDRGKALLREVDKAKRSLQKQIDARPDPGFLRSDPEAERLQEVLDSWATPEVEQLSAKETWDDALGRLREFLRENR